MDSIGCKFYKKRDLSCAFEVRAVDRDDAVAHGAAVAPQGPVVVIRNGPVVFIRDARWPRSVRLGPEGDSQLKFTVAVTAAVTAAASATATATATATSTGEAWMQV